MLRYYVDEDSMSGALLSALRAHGLDVLSTAEAGRRRSLDPDQLVFATIEERVLVTRNVEDFPALHALLVRGGGSHAGIVMLPPGGVMPGPYAQALADLADALSPSEMTNQIEFLSHWL